VENADILSIPLLYIDKYSLESGIAIVSSYRNEANVTSQAIFKKGDKSSQSNFRPVSFISQFCKVLESIVRDSIVYWNMLGIQTN